MKLRPALFRFRLSAFGLFAVLGVAVSSAPAAVTVNVLEQGGNVVASGSGTVNTAGLIAQVGAYRGAGVLQNGETLRIGGTTLVSIVYWSSISGPSSFGSGVVAAKVSSGSGDQFGIYASSGTLVLPKDYVSGATLTATSTWTATTFADLGLTPGTYVWTWGSGAAADSFTLNIGPVKVAAPTVKVTGKTTLTTTGATYKLKGTSANATSVKLRVRTGAAYVKATGVASWTFTAKLAKGVNTILVRAYNDAGTASKEAKVIITRK